LTLVEKCADAIQRLNEAWCPYEFVMSPSGSVTLVPDTALFTITFADEREYRLARGAKTLQPEVHFKGVAWPEVNSSEALTDFVAEWLQSYRMRRCG
jgi:hypothetical protein